MLYNLLGYIVPPIIFRVYFRRIYYSNLNLVPKDKPLILAGNHPNSFLDGVIVGSYLGQPIHFLVRADMFKNALIRWVLRELKVAPVYRIQEGYSNVHKNVETFSGVYEVLRKNEHMIVFSEGICVQEKRLQKLRKGTARMAFGAEETNGLDVHIVPVGLNYTYPSRFRKEIMISFAEPIKIKDFKEMYKANKAKAFIAFNKKLETAIRKEMVIIEDKKNELLIEKLFIIFRNNCLPSFFLWRSDSPERLRLEQSISEKINFLSKNSSSKIKSINKKVKNYFENLDKNKIEDKNFIRPGKFDFIKDFFILFGLPFFIFGYLSNIIPFLLPKYIVDKKVKDPKFYSAILVTIGSILYFIYFPIIMITSWFIGRWLGIFIGILVPIFGYLSLFYIEIFKDRFQFIRFNWLKRKNSLLIENLKDLRREIIRDVEKINYIFTTG